MEREEVELRGKNEVEEKAGYTHTHTEKEGGGNERFYIR